MDEASDQRAVAAVRIAKKHLMSAWQYLIGRRVPMVGQQRDLNKTVVDLRVVHEKTGKAIQLIQSAAPATE